MCRAISQTRIRYPWQIIMDKYGLQGWVLESSDNNAIWSRKQTNKKKVVQSGGELELRSLVLAVLGSWWVPHVNLVGIVGKQGSRQAWTRKRLYPEMPAEEFVIAAFLFHFGNLRFYFLYLRWSPSSGSNKIQYLATKFVIVRKIKMSVPIVSHVY